MRHAIVLERACIHLLQARNHLGFTLGAEHRRTLVALDLAHLMGQTCAPVQQIEQLAVNGVDGNAQLRKGTGHG